MVVSILLFLFLITTLQDIAADFASIKPSFLYYNYVGISWLTDSVVLAAGYSESGGVILRSTDQGKSWSAVGTQFSGLYGIASAQISGSWYSIAVDEAGVVYRSITNGMIWTAYDTNSTAILMGATIGSNGYTFISGQSYIAYSSSITASSLNWIETTPITGIFYYDIR